MLSTDDLIMKDELVEFRIVAWQKSRMQKNEADSAQRKPERIHWGKLLNLFEQKLKDLLNLKELTP